MSSSTVTTLAGSPSGCGYADGGALVAQFRYPFAVTMDSAGSFALIADNANSVIRRVVVSSGAVTTLAGGASSGRADGASIW